MCTDAYISLSIIVFLFYLIIFDQWESQLWYRNEIFITLPMAQEPRMLVLLDRLKDTTVSIYFVPNIFIFDLVQSRVEDIDGLSAIAID